MTKPEFGSEEAAKNYLLKYMSNWSDYVLNEYREALECNSEIEKTILYVGLKDILPSINNISESPKNLQLDVLKYVLESREEQKTYHEADFLQQNMEVVGEIIKVMRELFDSPDH